MRILLLLLLPMFSISQTCIISVLRNKRNDIVVAMDSRRNRSVEVIDRFGNKQQIVSFDTVCKVQNFGDIYFSLAGFDILNGYATAGRCAKENKNLEKTSKAFAKARKLELYTYLNKQIKDGNFQTNYEKNKSFSTMFYRIENGIAKMSYIQIKLISGVNDAVKLKDSITWFSASNDENATAFPIGHHNIVDTILTAAIHKYGIGDGLFYSIMQQAKATPDFVAEPIEIFGINKDGFYWIYNPLKCTTQ